MATLVQYDTPPWLTKDFLAHILRNVEKDASLTVDFIHVQPVVSKGDNYCSIIRKVFISFHDNGGRHKRISAVVKCVPGAFWQQYVKEACMFEKELYAYNSLLPAMRALTDSPLVSAKFFPVARPDTIVLEDITTRGFKMADRRAGLDLAHCLLALKTLAKFHGLSAEVVQRNPSIVEHFPESQHSKRTRDMNRRILPVIYRSLADMVETWYGFERFGEKIRCKEDTIIEELEILVAPEKNGFNVLNHGDFWVNNMMFRYSSETQRVEEVCLVDFQAIRYSSPAIDLHYFLATSTADGVREEHEDVLLKTYHEALIETIGAFGCDRKLYSLDQLKQDFYDKKLYGFHVGCALLCGVVAEPSEALDVDSLTEESFEAGTANIMARPLQGKRFKDVFQNLLLYYENNGDV